MTRNYRFDFGTGTPAEGYTKITPQSVYDSFTGYGFTRTDRINAKDRGEPGALRRDFCIPLDTAFLLDAEDGIYRVSVLLGDEIAETETTIKAGQGRLMVHKQRTAPGSFSRISFSVWVTGGQLKLSFSGLAPRINAMEVEPAPQACTLFLAGDSTVTDQPDDGYPYAGWGQMLPMFVKQDAAVANYALSGRSSRSFISEGVLDQIWSRIKPYDYLLIQFGHNDQKFDEERHTEPFTTYKQTLKTYIDGARERKAIPVLVTSVQRRFYEEDGTLRDTHGDYLTAVRELAAEEEVPLIDLAKASKALFEVLGPEETKKLFMWLAPGEFMNFPDGTEDNTHFQQLGGIEIARLVYEELKALKLQPLLLYLR
ncbi:GDSL-type esterase/lipase family protein [Paenibacillus sp. ATY16]|uniref:rhamnogalacturonan acetylesterase n=1 Tax=Paenibacillus sp. ATY16 TaxID=1759312 RepID=UPI00200DCF7F|nr:GDSL-type esterase/lipase family protein [Paenibacillus sp. ATY16]MCK9862838.1 GDSL-type esterase/lipase family protein [Paenibacillus sp. ATY16]